MNNNRLCCLVFIASSTSHNYATTHMQSFISMKFTLLGVLPVVCARTVPVTVGARKFLGPWRTAVTIAWKLFAPIFPPHGAVMHGRELGASMKQVEMYLLGVSLLLGPAMGASGLSTPVKSKR